MTHQDLDNKAVADNATDVSELLVIQCPPFNWDVLHFKATSLLVDSLEFKQQLVIFEKLIKLAWPSFCEQLIGHELFHLLQQKQQIQTEVYWVSDDEIQAINQQYRDKNSATDVLSFTLLSDSDETEMWLNLPEVELGSIFLSLDWAKKHCSDEAESFTAEAEQYHISPMVIFLLDRFLHGMLHLLGQHHDTLSDYERVVAVQKQARLFALNAFNELNND